MKRKEQFISAVRILAPGDALAVDAAAMVPEQLLPLFPGGAALEFVASLERLRNLHGCPWRRQWFCPAPFAWRGSQPRHGTQPGDKHEPLA